LLEARDVRPAQLNATQSRGASEASGDRGPCSGTLSSVVITSMNVTCTAVRRPLSTS